MSSVPAASSNIFWGVDTVFTLSGVTMAAVSNVHLQYGNKLHEDVVTGTDLPYVGTGVYHGEARLTTLGSSDNRWDVLVNAVSGIVPTVGFTFKENDTQTTMSARTWNCSGKFMEYEKIWDKDGAVQYKMRAILVTKPTVS